MKDKALEKHIIKVEVNPLQMAILINVLSNCMPDIRDIFKQNTPENIVVDFGNIEKSILEIYSVCYSETELFDVAKRVFIETGSYPDIHKLLEINANVCGHMHGAGEMKEIEFELILVDVMMIYLLLRGYYDQFEEMMKNDYSKLVKLDFGAMQASADAIYEANMAFTNIREKVAPIIEIFKMTGRLPDSIEN